MPRQTRRTFVQTAGTLMVATGITAIGQPGTAEKGKKNMFIHHVYFWLNRPGNEEDKKKLVEGLRKLSTVKTIQSFYIGQPADTARDVIDRSYAVSWLLFFNNAADQESYQHDPVHLDFVKECSPLWSKVMVYDTIDVSV